MSKLASRIFVCQPGYGHGHPVSHRQFWQQPLRWDSPYIGRIYQKSTYSGSLLARNFNSLWSEALTRRMAGEPITHFIMLHDDIAPNDGWVDTLMEVILLTGADLVSALVPQKSGTGLTSTAISNPDDNFNCERRVMINEAVLDLPDTFDITDLGYTDRHLLANTGCWVADITKPLFHERDEQGRLKVFFTINDEIRHTKGGSFSLIEADGTFVAGIFASVEEAERYRDAVLRRGYLTVKETDRLVTHVEPEDWFFSRRVSEMGGKVMVTRKVALRHFGEIPYNNYEDWGLWDHDKVMQPKKEEVPV